MAITQVQQEELYMYNTASTLWKDKKYPIDTSVSIYYNICAYQPYDTQDINNCDKYDVDEIIRLGLYGSTGLYNTSIAFLILFCISCVIILGFLTYYLTEYIYNNTKNIENVNMWNIHLFIQLIKCLSNIILIYKLIFLMI